MFRFNGRIIKGHDQRINNWDTAASISVIAASKDEADRKVESLMGDAGGSQYWVWKWHDIREDENP